MAGFGMLVPDHDLGGWKPSPTMQSVQAWLSAPSIVPGLTNSDCFSAMPDRKGAKKIFSFRNRDDPRFRDPEVLRRVKFWLHKSNPKKILGAACKAASLLRSGGKKVLALRLALNMLPAEVPAIAEKKNKENEKKKKKTTTTKRPLEAIDEQQQQQQKEKKPRKKSVTAKSLGLTKEEYDAIKIPKVRKQVKGWKLHWQEGCRGAPDDIARWSHDTVAPLQAIVNIGIIKGKAIEQCVAALQEIREQYWKFKRIQFLRGDFDEMWYNIHRDGPGTKEWGKPFRDNWGGRLQTLGGGCCGKMENVSIGDKVVPLRMDSLERWDIVMLHLLRVAADNKVTFSGEMSKELNELALGSIMEVLPKAPWYKVHSGETRDDSVETQSTLKDFDWTAFAKLLAAEM